jgi:hypothetical protein
MLVFIVALAGLLIGEAGGVTAGSAAMHQGLTGFETRICAPDDEK